MLLEAEVFEMVQAIGEIGMKTVFMAVGGN